MLIDEWILIIFNLFYDKEKSCYIHFEKISVPYTYKYSDMLLSCYYNLQYKERDLKREMKKLKKGFFEILFINIYKWVIFVLYNTIESVDKLFSEFYYLFNDKEEEFVPYYYRIYRKVFLDIPDNLHVEWARLKKISEAYKQERTKIECSICKKKFKRNLMSGCIDCGIFSCKKCNEKNGVLVWENGKTHCSECRGDIFKNSFSEEYKKYYIDYETIQFKWDACIGDQVTNLKEES